jgi:hypothetical protein
MLKSLLRFIRARIVSPQRLQRTYTHELRASELVGGERLAKIFLKKLIGGLLSVVVAYSVKPHFTKNPAVSKMNKTRKIYLCANIKDQTGIAGDNIP